MAKRVQILGYPTAVLTAMTGRVREVIADVTKKTLTYHDGATPGGFPLAREDLNNVGEKVILSRVTAGGLLDKLEAGAIVDKITEGNGILVKTAPGTLASRLLESTSGISITNPAGTAGNLIINGLPFVGASSIAAGVIGMVPAPGIGDDKKVLKGAGVWGYNVLRDDSTFGTALLPIDMNGLRIGGLPAANASGHPVTFDQILGAFSIDEDGELTLAVDTNTLTYAADKLTVNYGNGLTITANKLAAKSGDASIVVDSAGIKVNPGHGLQTTTDLNVKLRDYSLVKDASGLGINLGDSFTADEDGIHPSNNLAVEMVEEWLGVGSGNWTCPAGVFKAEVTVCGGGGGSYDASGLVATGETYFDKPGAGGGVSIKLLDVTPGDEYPYVVGAGGAGMIQGVSITPSAGAASSFNTSIIGNGGGIASNGVALGGTASGGEVNLPGESVASISFTSSASTEYYPVASPGRNGLGWSVDTFDRTQVTTSPYSKHWGVAGQYGSGGRGRTYVAPYVGTTPKGGDGFIRIRYWKLVEHSS